MARLKRSQHPTAAATGSGTHPESRGNAASACTWREAFGPASLERLRDLALAGVDGEHRGHDYRAVTVVDLETGSIDGSLIRVPDSAAEGGVRAGTADDWSPFPQLRELRISAASTRATFGVMTARPGPAAAGTKARPGRCCWTRR